MESFRVTKEEGEVLEIAGALEIGATEQLRAALAAALDDATIYGVDLSRVERCDTAAAQLLVSAQKSAGSRPSALRWLACSSAIAETAGALGLVIQTGGEK